MKAIDLTGQRFGRLTVLSQQGSGKNGRLWLCRCDCGAEKIVIGFDLRRGHTKSCGCLQADSTVESHTTHGKRYTRLYSIWKGMKRRCYNVKHTRYKHYGGRGIRICDEWRDDFQAFYDWAMANGYRDDLTIDRIDVDGNYEPNNCRWATVAEQNRNQRRNSKK